MAGSRWRAGRRRAPLLFGRTRWSLPYVFCLYAYQGLVAGFALTALTNHHAALGASGAEVAWHNTVVGLPWVLQPVWGPVVDRFGAFRMGRRRFWIAAALTGSLCMLLLLLAVPDEPGGLARTSLVLAGHSAFASLLDTAVDAMVIDRIPPEALGRANASTRAGFVSGIAVGAAFFASVLGTPFGQGLQAAAVLLVAAGAAVAMPLLALREEVSDAFFSLRRRREAGDGKRAAAPPLGRALRRLLLPMLRPQALALLAFCVAVEGAVSVVQLRIGLDLIQERGWSAMSLSQLQAGTGLVCGTLGAFAVGWWSDRLGALRGLSVVLSLSAAAYAGVGLLLAGGLEGAAPVATGLATGLPVLIFVALAPAVMRASRGPGAATRFALFMAALNLGSVGGNAVAGELGTDLPVWAPVLAAGCVLAGCALLARRPRLLFRRGVEAATPAGAAEGG